VLNGTIASAFADSDATSHVGTKKDRVHQAFITTDRQSDKAFHMPNGLVEEATALDALQHNLRAPARGIHIVPSIERDLLLSVSKFIDANYIAIFDKDEVKIFDANNTEIMVSRAAILRGWRCPDTKLWCIPLVKHVTNANTDTILCDRPPSEFLPERPPPTEAVANVYELKTQPELIRYYHVAAGFPTKPTWVTAIKNCQFASWPGLTAKAATKHFPESEETAKGHGRKTRSGLRSTKKTGSADSTDDDDNDEDTVCIDPPPRPATRTREIFYAVYDLKDEAQLLDVHRPDGTVSEEVEPRKPVHHGTNQT